MFGPCTYNHHGHEIKIWVLCNWWTYTITAVSCCHMIPICDLHNWLPTNSGEADNKITNCGDIISPLKTWVICLTQWEWCCKFHLMTLLLSNGVASQIMVIKQGLPVQYHFHNRLQHHNFFISARFKRYILLFVSKRLIDVQYPHNIPKTETKLDDHSHVCMM